MICWSHPAFLPKSLRHDHIESIYLPISWHLDPLITTGILTKSWHHDQLIIIDSFNNKLTPWSADQYRFIYQELSWRHEPLIIVSIYLPVSWSKLVYLRISWRHDQLTWMLFADPSASSPCLLLESAARIRIRKCLNTQCSFFHHNICFLEQCWVLQIWNQLADFGDIREPRIVPLKSFDRPLLA